MFSFTAPGVQRTSKCYVTYGIMSHVDGNHRPTKAKPWATILGRDFLHKVELLIPEECAQHVFQAVQKTMPPARYCRVTLRLGDILHGGFFSEYLKPGKILMLSEGRIGADNVFSVKNGILSMYLDKETYERAGIVGKPHGVKGSRGLKPRWVVECDLTQPSMIHGKRGFDRLVYACKTVFNNPLTWLICNPESSAPDPDPLAPHSPISFHATQTLSEAQTVLVPPLRPSSTILSDRGRLTDYATETYEWLSLVRLASPRVEIGDDIDPYLSRYRVPDGEPSEGASEMKEARVRKITWAGFISSQWARDCLVNSLVAIPSRTWFSMSMASVHNTVVGDAAELTFLRPPGSPGEYVLWDIEPAEL